MGELKDCPVCGGLDILLKRQYRRVYYECVKCRCCGYSAHTRLGAKLNWNNDDYRKLATKSKNKKY